MQRFEYKVMPAPKRGKKGKGVKGSEAQFANALGITMNEAAADGWEYLRTDTLPCEERQGLTGRVTVFQNMLVFRRPLEVEVEEAAPAEPPLTALPAPQPETPVDMGAEDDDAHIPAPNPQISDSLTHDRVAAE